MIAKETQKLREKINELKNNYEKIKKEREELSEEINELDNNLKELDYKLNATIIIQKQQSGDYKKRLKTNKKKIISRNIIQLGVIALIDWIFFDFGVYPMQISFLLSLNAITDLIIPVIVDKMIDKSRKKNIAEMMKEYSKQKDKRISLGQSYNKIRVEEINAYNLYTKTEESINKEMNNLIKNNQKTSSIHMEDIYRKIRVDKTFYSESTETQKDILNIKLKNYLIDKINKIPSNNIEVSNLELLSTKELIYVLTEYIPANEHHKTLNHVIHAILGFAGNMQGHSIVWQEETDESLINTPLVIFDDDGRWDKLITHENTSYKTIFETAHDTFFHRKTKNKSRSKHK